MPSWLSEEKQRQVMGLLLAGHSDLEVHRQTGVCRKVIARYRKGAGLPVSRVQVRGQVSAPLTARWREADPVAVERAVSGDPPMRLSPRERHEAIVRLNGFRLPASLIAERVGCSLRTVHRVRSRSLGVAA